MLKEEEGMELSLDVSADPIPPTPKNYNIISNIIDFNNILSISMCCGILKILYVPNWYNYYCR